MSHAHTHIPNFINNTHAPIEHFTWKRLINSGFKILLIRGEYIVKDSNNTIYLQEKESSLVTAFAIGFMQGLKR